MPNVKLEFLFLTAFVKFQLTPKNYHDNRCGGAVKETVNDGGISFLPSWFVDFSWLTHYYELLRSRMTEPSLIHWELEYTCNVKKIFLTMKMHVHRAIIWSCFLSKRDENPLVICIPNSAEFLLIYSSWCPKYVVPKTMQKPDINF